MKVAVTGAGGFLGTELLRQLARQGEHEVLAISNKNPRVLAARSGFGELEVVAPQKAIRDIDTLSRVDILVNCAFPRNVDGRNMAQGMRFIDTVFGVAADAGVASVINISSQSVYDQSNPAPAAENSDVFAYDAYSTAKLASELLLAAKCPNMIRVNLRLASLIGPGFGQRVVNKMVSRALAGEPIIVADNGSLFGYLDVRDAASGVLALIEEARAIPKEALYNLGPDRSYSLTEIGCTVQTVCENLLGRSVELVHMAPPLGASLVFSGIDSSLFRRRFKWCCRYNLEDSVMTIAEEILADGEGGFVGVAS